MECTLIEVRNDEKVEEYIAQGKRITVGRELGNVVQLTHPKVSKNHALILLDDDSAAIEDLNSSNGTLLNGMTVKASTALHHGDRIHFGPIECIFIRGRSAEAIISIDSSEDMSAMTLPGISATDIEEMEKSKRPKWWKSNK